MVRTLIKLGIGKLKCLRVNHRQRIDRARRSYLEEKGWVPDGDRYHGTFNSRHGPRVGQIQMDGSQLSFFILDPPAGVFSGSHAPCFEHVGNNWFYINFRRKPSNPSDGIMEVERVLNVAE